jgi:hypothetical protein
MTTPGLNSTDFNTMFPEFVSVSSSLITTFINLINNGYLFTVQNVTDPTILNIYYWYVAHLVAVSTQTITGTLAGPSGSYLPNSETAGLVATSFQEVKDISADQSFMLSTRYGQVFWVFTKQQYVQNFYLNQSWWY